MLARLTDQAHKPLSPDPHLQRVLLHVHPLDEQLDNARLLGRETARPRPWQSRAPHSVRSSPGCSRSHLTAVSDLLGTTPQNKRLDHGEPKKVVVIDRAYVATNTPIIRDRLVKAAVRLGSPEPGSPS